MRSMHAVLWVVFILTNWTTSSQAQGESQPDIIAMMKGKCEYSLPGKKYPCKLVSYFLFPDRANFTIVVDDPFDDGHVVSFSGQRQGGRMASSDTYELLIDRILLNSQYWPKANGLPVPVIEKTQGACKQIGDFTSRRVLSVSCTAKNQKGESYSLAFETDGSPIAVTRGHDERVASASLATNRNSFVGRWYAESVAACSSDPGNQDNGIIAYTPRKFIGYESECDIRKIETKENRHNLTLRCSSEGEEMTMKERLEVVDGMLRRTTLGGNRRFSFTYRRCPGN